MSCTALSFVIAFLLWGQGQKAPGSFDNSRGATPDALHSVGVRGSVDAGGYAASAAARTQTSFFRELADLQVVALRPALLPAQRDCSPGAKARLEAINLLTNGDASTAANQLESALKLEDAPESRQVLGLAYEALGRLEAASGQFLAAANKQRSNNSYFAAGAALLLVGDIERASSIFQKCHDGLAQAGVGAAQFQGGRVAEAIAMFLEAARSKEPDAAFTFLAVSLPAAEAETVTKAEQQLSSVVAQTPLNAEAHLAYAAAIAASARNGRETAKPAQMEKELRRALQLDPQLTAAYLQLGSALSVRGEIAAAIEAYRRALQLDKSLVDAHYRLSQLYMRSADQEKGREELKLHARALELQHTEIGAGRIPIRFRSPRDIETKYSCP